MHLLILEVLYVYILRLGVFYVMGIVLLWPPYAGLQRQDKVSTFQCFLSSTTYVYSTF